MNCCYRKCRPKCFVLHNYTFLLFQAKLFQIKKQLKYFGIVIVNIVIILSSSDDFSVATATPDETAGKDTEFSLVVSLINK